MTADGRDHGYGRLLRYDGVLMARCVGNGGGHSGSLASAKVDVDADVGAGTGAGSSSGGRDSRDQRQEANGQQHVATAHGKDAKINMDNRVVLDDKRMHLYLHLDLPQHPPTSASALFYGYPLDNNDTAAAEHGTGDVGLFVAGIKNAAFPPGPQVVVGMPKEDYVAAEAKEPVTVKGVSPSGVPVVAKLRDAIPPFSSEPGHRTIVKPTGNLLGISIHPRIKEVGLRMAAMEIASSNARTIAALNAFIDFINDYNTPSDTVLNRNLTWHLSAQLNFLVYQRPMCIGMGNAIRWLKNEIAKTSASIQDGEAKIKLTSAIHDYIKERITAAGDVIAEAGAQKIQDGDVVLTYGASSTVQRLLIAARDMGRRFRVVVIDSRPENDGRKLVRELVEAGFSDLSSGAAPSDTPYDSPTHDIRSSGRGRSTVNNGITYAPITALSFIMREASKVFLGAEAFFANGSMLSRSGTAIVALAARSYHVPVIVSCETYKFSERIQLDAVVNNELGFPDTLMYKAGIPDAEPVGPQSDPALSEMEYSAYARDRYSAHPRWNNRSALANSSAIESSTTSAASALKKGKSARSVAPVETTRETKTLKHLNTQCSLSNWRSDRSLRLVNITQDVTPPEFVSVIITEVGMIPTTSIPVVLREYKNQI
ncbi:hypothetical protein GGI25_002092 [Coemansia spiralis]|uniref:Translation initiation factor eIF2B subunit delta n=1 Tax=Coemansia spiralis TaxID=417178 RepID=A0A9W8G8Z2_9FUNG|nr:hypothetical protein GGI25_002092 [Coemansia spiralis]